MYQTQILNIKNKLHQNPRSVDELNDKLHQIFKNNNSKHKQIKNIYDDNSWFKKMEYEHYQIEKVKKQIYGDSYEIQTFGYDKSQGKDKEWFLSL